MKAASTQALAGRSRRWQWLERKMKEQTPTS
jgi:hypothetical protein